MDEYESVEPSEPGPTIAPLPVDTFTLTGHMWEATAALRGIMALHGEPMTISRIASNLPRTGPRKRGRPRADVADADLYDQLAILVRGGLVTSANSGVHPRTYYRLTPDGLASVQRAGIPKQPKAAERGPSSHAAEVARTVAESARVTVHAMLTSPVGPATLARARLCGALHGRGWDAGAIERTLRCRTGGPRRASSAGGGCRRGGRCVRKRRRLSPCRRSGWRRRRRRPSARGERRRERSGLTRCRS